MTDYVSRGRPRALLIDDHAIPLTGREHAFLICALRARIAALGRLIDGGEPISDEEDRDVRIELAGLNRIAHIACTGELPSRDAAPIAAWRAATAKKLNRRLRSTAERRRRERNDQIITEPQFSTSDDERRS